MLEIGAVDDARAVVEVTLGTVADTVTVIVTVETVVVTGAAVEVLVTAMVDPGATNVEVVLTVVVEGVKQQRQAQETADEAKAVR